jgi:hypothetical protein
VAVIVQLLPRLANDAGVDMDRLLGSLLVELGYEVGLSHPPDAAVDALAAATERLRDAMSRRREPKPKAKLPPPNVPGPTMLQLLRRTTRRRRFGAVRLAAGVRAGRMAAAGPFAGCRSGCRQ